MKLAGIILILLSSLRAGYVLERDAWRGSKHITAFIGFIGALKTGLECYLESAEDVASSYKDPLLDTLGFLRAVKEGKTLHGAYLDVREKIKIPKEADKVLKEFFSRFGRGYLTGEVRAVERALSSLKEIRNTEDKRAESRGRALKISAPTLGIGIVILLI